MDIQPSGNRVHQGPAPTERITPAAADPAPALKTVVASVEAASSVRQPVAVPDMEQAKQAVQNLNKMVKALSPDLEFSIDEDSNRTIVKVVDQQTKEVIRQFPTKEALEIAKALDHMQGLLIRQKA